MNASASGTGAPAEAEEVLPENPPGVFLTLPSGERIYVRNPTPELRARVAADEARTAAAAERPAETPAPAPVVPIVPEARAEPAERDLADDELRDMVEIVPGALVRWGITAIALAVFGAAGVAAAVRFPVVVSGIASVTTTAPPVRVATAGGEIQRLLVRDGQAVRTGEVLAVMRASADHSTVLALREALRSAPAGLPAAPTLLAGVDRARLGELLEPLARYEGARAEYAEAARNPLLPARAAALRGQVEQQVALVAGTENRATLLERDAALAEREAERSREMVRRQLLSVEEGNRAESAAITRRQTLAAARNDVLVQQMRLSDLRQQLLEAQGQQGEDARRLQNTARQALSSLLDAIAQWEQRVLVRASADGRVTFFKRLSQGQYLAPGEPVLAVVPGAGRGVANVRIGPGGVGRVRAGQRVVLRFDAYPSAEYGTVEGVVRSVSLVADEPVAREDVSPGYLVTVDLPRGLRTSTGAQLALRQEMSGTADIVAEERSVLERLVFRLRAAGGRP